MRAWNRSFSYRLRNSALIFSPPRFSDLYTRFLHRQLVVIHHIHILLHILSSIRASISFTWIPTISISSEHFAAKNSSISASITDPDSSRNTPFKNRFRSLLLLAIWYDSKKNKSPRNLVQWNRTKNFHYEGIVVFALLILATLLL